MMGKIKYIFFLILIICCVPTYANTYFSGFSKILISPADSVKKNSRKNKKDSLQIRSRWFYKNTLDLYSLPFYNAPDTSLNRFQLYRPMFRKTYFAKDLGNLGTPFYPLYIEPATPPSLEIEWMPLDVFSYKNSSITYYDSKIPLTHLYYENGANEENLFVVSHNQNIRPNFNAGLDYRIINSKGAYLSQNSNHRNFNIHANFYTPKRSYEVYANAIYNRQYLAENGGMIRNATSTNSAEEEVSYSVFLKKAQSDFVNKSLNLKQYLNFFPNRHLRMSDTLLVKDSLSKDSLPVKKIVEIFEYAPRIKISHQLNLNVTSHSFRDDLKTDFGYYDTLYLNQLTTFDSSYFFKTTNTFLIHKTCDTLQTNFWDNFRMFTGVQLENLKYKTGYLPADTSYSINKNFNNQFALLHLGIGKPQGIAADAEFKYGLSGYNQKNSDLNLELKKLFASIGLLTVFEYNIGQKKPSYFYYEHSSNAYRWNNATFGDIKYSALSFSLAWKRWKASIRHVFLRDYIYFNSNYELKQYNDAINSIAAKLSKETTFKWLHFDANLLYQTINENPSLSVPQLAAYGSIYAESYLIKRTLRTQIGFDVFYNTKYFSAGYNPAIPAFYSQREYYTGEYPYVDFFLNAHLKRARAFIKIEHLNAGLSGNNYYEAANYLMQGRSFRFGISWYLLY